MSLSQYPQERIQENIVIKPFFLGMRYTASGQTVVEWVTRLTTMIDLASFSVLQKPEACLHPYSTKSEMNIGGLVVKIARRSIPCLGRCCNAIGDLLICQKQLE